MSEPIHYDRRRFIGTAVIATAGAGLLGSRLREPGSSNESSPALTNDSLGASNQIDAGRLKVEYAEAGRSDGPAIILLHASPRDINSREDVAPLAASGYRVIAPYVRGKGTKRLASNGEQSVAPADVMALMDALNIQQALVCGVDGCAQAAEVMAALWPQRVKGIAPGTGYGLVNLAANQRPLPQKEELAWWYQYYFARARSH